MASCICSGTLIGYPLIECHLPFLLPQSVVPLPLPPPPNHPNVYSYQPVPPNTIHYVYQEYQKKSKITDIRRNHTKQRISKPALT